MKSKIWGGSQMEEIKESKMGTEPVGSLLLKMSAPAVFSMLIQALYNIVDSIYISYVSQEAIFAMTVVFPMQIILTGIALGGAIGTSTLVARRLGQRNYDEANKTASTGFILVLFHSVLCAVLGLVFARPLMALFTQDQQIIEMGYMYLSIVMTVNIGVCLGMFFERLFQAQGNMVIPMCSLLIGALTNIILDPIFIFGYGFIPAMGIRGAAIATVLGQLLALVFTTTCVFFIKQEVKIQFKGLKLQWIRIKEIYSIGIPITVMNVIGAFANMSLNSVVNAYSDLAVSALGLYFKLSSFIFMPVFGLNQGTLPILSFNYGAQNKERYEGVVKLYFMVALSIMSVGTILFWTQTDLVISLFKTTTELRAMTRHVLRIISLCFPFFGIAILMSTVFQSLGRAFSSMVLSILRQFVVLVPLAYLFGRLFGIDGLWYAYVCAEILVMIYFAPRCYKAYKQAFEESK